MREIKVVSSKAALSEFAAEYVVKLIHEILQQQNYFSLVLSGGSTPAGLYKLLASEKYASQIDWEKIHFFWGDERYVPFDDDRNNAKMAWDLLLSKVPVNKNQVYEMPTNIPADEAAIVYDELLHQYFNDKKPGFDLVLLGMGGDGHTLSLFPGYKEIINETERWTTAFWLVAQDMYRITLTSSIVNASRVVMFLVSGNDKAAALHEVISDVADPYQYPSSVIQPSSGKLTWLVDEAAAGSLPDNLIS